MFIGAIISFRNELDGIEIKEYDSRSYKKINEEKRKENITIKKQLDLHFLHKVNGYLPNLLLKDIVDHHPLLQDYLFTGYGSALMNIDSKIAEGVLKRLTYKKIPALCVHDSFIVESCHQAALIEVMNQEYSKMMNGVTCDIKIK